MRSDKRGAMPKDRRNDIGTKVLGSILAGIVVILSLRSSARTDQAIAETHKYSKEVVIVKNDLSHIQIGQGELKADVREVRDGVKTILLKIGG